MPTKKTTKKKAPATKEKPSSKKSTTKSKVSSKKKSTTSTTKKAPATKASTVIVKENTVKKDACHSSCGQKARATIAIVLLVINTVLLGIIAFRTSTQKAIFNAMEEFEAMRVGGVENHEIMKEIYQLDAYKNDQKMRLETTLNALKQMGEQPTQPVEMPTE